MADEQHDREWFDVGTVAAFLGVTKRAWHASWKRHVPPAALRPGGRGKPTLVHGPSLVKALLERAVAAERERHGDDALLVGADSPSLDRLRRARAQLAELDLAERRKVLLNVVAMERGLN